MASNTKANGYWTPERIGEEARKYEHRVDFFRSCSAAYSAAQDKVKKRKPPE
jgi:hypothetical protein